MEQFLIRALFKVMAVLLTTIVPSLPWFLWNASISLNGKSQIISEFKTKKGSSSSVSNSRAKASGPAKIQ